ncbi:MAG: hypothetical protein PHX61_12640 [Alphaproteobacteria bacterium]|nr:hypothetical protein [Alphaproteobacteria bacterium]
MDSEQIKKAPQEIYHLKGRSHEAADQLYQRVYKLQDLPKLTAEQLAQIKDALDLKPVITVDYNKNDFPRAYRMTPSVAVIHMSNRDPEFYMLTPTGYNGETSQPADAELLSGKKERIASNGLFMGGHSTPIFVISGSRNGVELPEDYSKTSSLHATAQGHFMADFNFFARKQKPALWEIGYLFATDLYRSFFSASFHSRIRPMMVEGEPHLAVSKKLPAHTPIGHTPISHELFVWRYQDEFDRAIGVAPPPMPKPLADEYRKLKEINGGIECSPS